MGFSVLGRLYEEALSARSPQIIPALQSNAYTDESRLTENRYIVNKRLQKTAGENFPAVAAWLY
jgi:hypothetical protein